MEQARGRAVRQAGVLTLVLSGHVLLVIFVSGNGQSDKRTELAPSEFRTAIVLLDPELPAQQPLGEQTPEVPARINRTRVDRGRKPPSAPNEPSGDPTNSTATSSGEAAVVPRIDWQQELETGVETVEPQMIKEYTRLCAEAERTHAPRPAGCNRRSFDGPWRPSGNLLRDMRDPDRPRSSVPDPLPAAFPKAPRPEAFRNDH